MLVFILFADWLKKRGIGERVGVRPVAIIAGSRTVVVLNLQDVGFVDRQTSLSFDKSRCLLSSDKLLTFEQSVPSNAAHFCSKCVLVSMRKVL